MECLRHGATFWWDRLANWKRAEQLGESLQNPVHPEPVEGLVNQIKDFDRLSPNGGGLAVPLCLLIITILLGAKREALFCPINPANPPTAP
jgi:hypothetical protein